MQIITLTTDMGYRDHYVASIKGAILKLLPTASVIDISHEVKPFDVAEAAFHVANCYKDFPAGTVHVIGVDSEPLINFGGSDGAFPSILVFEGQYFISNDNGFFGSFLQDQQPEGFYRIDNVLSNQELFKFPTKNMFIPAACRLLKGEDVASFASPEKSFKKAFVPNALIDTNLIKGSVIHVDVYGNLITNIHVSLFERFGKDVPFTIYYRNKDYHIDEISPTYNSVPNGEKVAIISENGWLEIAINRGANASGGGAEKLFGLRIGDIIRIEFTPRGSRSTIDSLF